MHFMGSAADSRQYPQSPHMECGEVGEMTRATAERMDITARSKSRYVPINPFSFFFLPLRLVLLFPLVSPRLSSLCCSAFHHYIIPQAVMRSALSSRALARGLTASQRRSIHSSTVLRSTQAKAITSVLIANRGEIALRVGRTASDLGVRCTTIYTDPDAQSQHALSSPFSVNLGAPTAYLDGEKIIAAAKANGCEALHPGYGFLSENAAFAKRCGEEGLIFIGPPPSAIEAMGNKSRSKDIMEGAGVPCVPGYHGEIQDPDFLLEESKKMGFPVLIKAVKGGGGKGMRIAMNEGEFLEKLESAKSEGRNSFGDDVMLVEKYIQTPRHIEVQVFADRYGNAVALGERDCSLQRRHQKIIEEAPAPNLAKHVQQDLWAKARAAALAVGYEGAGTVECRWPTISALGIPC